MDFSILSAIVLLYPLPLSQSLPLPLASLSLRSCLPEMVSNPATLSALPPHPSTLQATAVAAQANLLRQQEELERKAAELDRREQELQSRGPTGHYGYYSPPVDVIGQNASWDFLLAVPRHIERTRKSRSTVKS